MKCPHCGLPINPAAELARQRAKIHKPTSDQMRELARKRWQKKQESPQ